MPLDQMSDAEHIELLAARLREYRRASYPDLADLTDRTDVSVGFGRLGTRFRVEVSAVWDLEDAEAIWVYATAFPTESRQPLGTLGFLINSYGELIRQDAPLDDPV